MVTPRCSSQCYGQHNITFYVLLLKLTLCCSRNIIHDQCLRAFFSLLYLSSFSSLNWSRNMHGCLSLTTVQQVIVGKSCSDESLPCIVSKIPVQPFCRHFNRIDRLKLVISFNQKHLLHTLHILTIMKLNNQILKTLLVKL